MEVGCLRHPVASTIGSQLLDGDIQATSHEPPRQTGGPLSRQALLGEKGSSWPGKPEPQRETAKSDGTQKKGSN